jgi:hypothetical protein
MEDVRSTREPLVIILIPTALTGAAGAKRKIQERLLHIA